VPIPTKHIIEKLTSFIENEQFRGYDPYDTLNSFFPLHLLGRYGQSLAIQIQKRNPLNIRGIIGIKKGHNPKGLGLLLEAYSRLLIKTNKPEYKNSAELLFSMLMANSTPGYRGRCWGYNFVWANPEKVLPAYYPSIVVTAFVGKGVFEYYRATRNEEAIPLLREICDYIILDLPRTETPQGICFSYTNISRDCCYNASLLGAEILAKTFALTGEKHLRDLSLQAADFVAAHQHRDGRWNYSLRLDGRGERKQVDFHQGFILASLTEIIEETGISPERYSECLKKGALFYRDNQFFDDGRSKWRYPKRFPIDIHHQAQGIITFAALSKIDPSYLTFAQKILKWTVGHLWDEGGFFYYQKNRLYTNKISYLRWGQAWMLVALSLLYAADGKK